MCGIWKSCNNHGSNRVDLPLVAPDTTDASSSITEKSNLVLLAERPTDYVLRC